jgi:hypothetical protein
MIIIHGVLSVVSLTDLIITDERKNGLVPEILCGQWFHARFHAPVVKVSPDFINPESRN